jgi:hypothetical protein
MNGLFIEQAHVEVGLAAVADVFGADGVGSDVFSMKKHNRIVFVIHWGVGTTGVNKFTVEACDDVTPSNTTAIPFHYRILTAEGDPGAVTYASVAATGYSNVAGSNQVILVEVTAAEVKAAGYDFVRLYADETTDAAVLGGVLAILLDPIYAEGELSTVA